MSQRILLLEDDHTLGDLLAGMLRHEGYAVDVLADGESAPTPAVTSRYDVIVTDVHLAGDEDGHSVVRRVHAAHPRTPVIVMTAYADVDGAMNAMAKGAYDYLPKPIDPTALRKMIAAALERRRVADDGKPASRRSTPGRIVGSSPSMIELFKTVAQVAPTTATALIVGESGSGKELVARALHEKSLRASKPFVAVNCGALPESVLETELFGHEKGAFTGATSARRGVFEEADGGTLFLDEIGDISPKMQVQLLRALETGEIRRVGGDGSIKVDVRVIAATHRDLRADVAAGRFREDLYFRLQVVILEVPPLRDRKSDIPLLVEHFAAEVAERLGKGPLRVADDALATLQSYDYPGNVRELRHLLERAALLSQGGVITAEDLPPETKMSPEARSAAGLDADWPTLAVLDRRYIDRVLSRTSGNKTRAAEILGIDRRTLNRIFARERDAQSHATND